MILKCITFPIICYCSFIQQFASTCDTPSLVDFSTTLQNLVITTHNAYRNQVASGRTKLDPAVNMSMLVCE